MTGPLTLAKLIVALGLGLVGGACIVGYGLAYNPKMKALGITPKQILGLKAAQPRLPPSAGSGGPRDAGLHN